MVKAIVRSMVDRTDFVVDVNGDKLPFDIFEQDGKKIIQLEHLMIPWENLLELMPKLKRMVKS